MTDNYETRDPLAGANLAPWLRKRIEKVQATHNVTAYCVPVPTGSPPYSYRDYKGQVQTLVPTGLTIQQRSKWSKLTLKQFR